MSTKNIARTAIEGGRSTYNKYERWQSNRTERRAANMQLRRIEKDPDTADKLPFAVRELVRKDFADKLSPAYRWLAKKGLGKTAHEIIGLLLTTFDTRSLAGRHLVFDHLMPREGYRGERWSQLISLGYAGYAFDDQEILRDKKRRRLHPRKGTKKQRLQALAWYRSLGEDAGVTLGVVHKNGRWWFVKRGDTKPFRQLTSKEEVHLEVLKTIHTRMGWQPLADQLTFA